MVDLTATVLAAECSGLARWMLDTATEYAKVREQFGKPIGSFQAVKHMCAEMLLRSQQISVAAADAAGAVADADEAQLSIAVAVAAAIGIEAAKVNARDCIQVLGGIGITWEHDAHLYMRRAYANAQFLGGKSFWLRRCAQLTRDGVRRKLFVDVTAAEDIRPEIAAVAADIAALPEEKRQVALAETGLMAPHWPKPYGRDASPAEQLVIDQELEAAGVKRPDISIGWWAAPTILGHGTPEQIEKFIPGTLDGDVYWCQLFSEPGAGSDLAALRTKAVRTDGGWLLTGQKVWTSNAHRADWGICLARTNPDVPKHKGITYFLVDMRSPGIDIRPLREITGEALFNEVFLDDLFVPDEMVVGSGRRWLAAGAHDVGQRAGGDRDGWRSRQGHGAPARDARGRRARPRRSGPARRPDRGRSGGRVAGSIDREDGGRRTRPRGSVERAQADRGAVPADAGRDDHGFPRRVGHRRFARRALLPEHAVPVDRGRHRADPAEPGGGAVVGAAALTHGL